MTSHFSVSTFTFIILRHLTPDFSCPKKLTVIFETDIIKPIMSIISSLHPIGLFPVHRGRVEMDGSLMVSAVAFLPFHPYGKEVT